MLTSADGLKGSNRFSLSDTLMSFNCILVVALHRVKYANKAIKKEKGGMLNATGEPFPEVSFGKKVSTE